MNGERLHVSGTIRKVMWCRAEKQGGSSGKGGREWKNVGTGSYYEMGGLWRIFSK